MKVSELAKEKGYSASEFVFAARESGLKVESSKAEIGVHDVALLRARLPAKSRLKVDNPALFERLAEGSVKVRDEEKAAKAAVPKKPRERKPTIRVAKPKPAAPAEEKEAAEAKPPLKPREKAPAKEPAAAEERVSRKKKEIEVKIKDLGGPSTAPAAPAPPAKTPAAPAAEEKEATHVRAPLIKVEEPPEKVRMLRPVEVAQAERATEEAAARKGRPVGREADAATRARLKKRPRPPAEALRAVRPRPPQIPVAERKVQVAVPIFVRDFSQQAGIKTADILRKLLENGVMATINTALDEDAVLMLALEFKREIEVRKEKKLEDTVIERPKDKPEDLKPRAPIVTIMGHVDHGKTTLLDRIRQSNVAAKEFGGITQHIGAYRVRTAGGKEVVFLDTPGHEAFTQMRARGSKVTDLVVLVVSAEDGVMPQTEESINHAKAANVPIVVAVNKIDRPEANPQKVKNQLASAGLAPEEWGGQTVMVECSALTGQNIPELVELLALQAELLELKANPNAPASGTVLEARMAEGKGVVATLLVQRGTLRRGDVVLCGATVGRMRSMEDGQGRMLEEAAPATPVAVTGLEELPEPGDPFLVVADLKQAREIASGRQAKRKESALGERQRVTLEGLYKRMKESGAKELRLIVKADMQGSAEVLRQTLSAIQTPEIKVAVLHCAVGSVNESDVTLADASQAVIVGFHVDVEGRAEDLAKEKGIQVRLHKVIYELLEEVKASLEGMLEPDRVEETKGRLEILEVFKLPKAGNVAGCMVREGKIERTSQMRVWRGKELLHTGRVASLKRHKDDVREVLEGFECGVKIEGYDKVQKGDLLETFEIKLVPRKVFAR